MLEHTKMHLIKKRRTAPSSLKQKKLLLMRYRGEIYEIPKKIAEKYKVARELKSSDKSILADDFFADLDKKFTRAGVLLQGTRHRENMTQKAFAEKIGVSQADLSKMEKGTRPIGKTVAKRIAKFFGVDYRYFLQ